MGEVFELHNYEVKVSEVRTFENSKRQYDVIAKKDYSIIVDCKKWDNKRRIKHALRSAVEDQIERVRKLENSERKYPMIVTSSNSPVKFHREVPVISISKLNQFLSNFQVYKEELLCL